MLALLCFFDATVFSVNKNLYIMCASIVMEDRFIENKMYIDKLTEHSMIVIYINKKCL